MIRGVCWRIQSDAWWPLSPVPARNRRSRDARRFFSTGFDHSLGDAFLTPCQRSVALPERRNADGTACSMSQRLPACDNIRRTTVGQYVSLQGMPVPNRGARRATVPLLRKNRSLSKVPGRCSSGMDNLARRFVSISPQLWNICLGAGGPTGRAYRGDRRVRRSLSPTASIFEATKHAWMLLRRA